MHMKKNKTIDLHCVIDKIKKNIFFLISLNKHMKIRIFHRNYAMFKDITENENLNASLTII